MMCTQYSRYKDDVDLYSDVTGTDNEFGGAQSCTIQYSTGALDFQMTIYLQIPTQHPVP